MQAYKAATTVDPAGEIRIREVPFRPGAKVEVIILEPEASVRSAQPRTLSPERQAALDRTLARSYALGGKFPNRDDLYER